MSNDDATSLTFLGAARTVTGSKHLLRTGGHQVLVDCGLFQGLKSLRERNWQALPVKSNTIDTVVLTHAHLDHCGYLPRLVSQGFRGRIFCTPATAELTRIVLADAAHLQEEDAERANRRGYTRHQPALPLFTTQDAERTFTLLQPLGYERPMAVAPGVTVEFINAGHLLGSSYARMRIESSGKTLLFGGDLGRYGRPVLPDPKTIEEADVLLVESTYGNRTHEPDDDGEMIAKIINDAATRGGKLIIPAFALGRTEELLYWINRLEEAGRIPTLPVYVDSPMAASVLELYRARLDELDPEIAQHGATRARPRRQEVVRVLHGATHGRLISAGLASRAGFHPTGDRDLIEWHGHGGRVLHHLEHGLPDPRNTVLFVGFQAAGTRGRQLRDGAKFTRIHGIDVPVAAHIEAIDSMSAHADANEILRWLKGFTRPPALTCLVHGEPEPMDALRDCIRHELNWNVATPGHQERMEL